MAGDVHFPKVQLLLLPSAGFTDLSYNEAVVHNGPITLTDLLPGILNDSYSFPKNLTGTPFWVEHAYGAEIAEGKDFALEISAYCQKNLQGSVLFSNRTSGGTANGLIVGLDPMGRPFVRVIHNGVLKLAIQGSRVAANDALRLIKVHRKGGIWGLMLDGVPQYDLGHQPVYNGAIQHGEKFYIGCDPYTTCFVGGINQLRLTIGEARQTQLYAPSILPWPIYATDPNILFGTLSTNITTRNAAVSILLDIENAAAVSVAAVDGANNAVGSDWEIASYPAGGGQNTYRITGTAPSALADYTLVITGTTDSQHGELDRSQDYRIYNTSAGTLSPMQNLLASIGGTKLWLDANDSTTISLSGSNVNQILNKIDSMPLVAATSRPKPVLDTTSMNQNSIKFIANASSGLVPTVPIVLTGADSGSAVILGGKYVGTQLGQGAGLFQISYGDDDAREDGTAAWVLSSSLTGEDNAAVSMYDSSARQNGIGTDAVLEPGDTFVIAWTTGANRADIWVNQRLISENELAGTLGFWSSVSAAIGFIGGPQSPTGAFITMNTLIAIDKELNESDLEALMSAVNHDINAYPAVPFTTVPSDLNGYIGNPFIATTIVTDAETVEIEGTGGTNWAITPSGSSIPGEHVITGTLPATPGTLQLTITMDNNGVEGIDVYQIEVLALPTTPTVETPLNLFAQRNSSFASLLNVFSADTVSIVGSSGTGWTIEEAPENDSGNYLITGVAPDTLGSMTLTITASLYDEETELTVQTVRAFTVVVGPNLDEEPHQYPVDLTGLLSSNKITSESQTLTSANGIKHQLLIPVFAPFFGDSLLLQFYNAEGERVDAVAGVDYVSVLEQGEMSRLADSKIYSGVLVLNPTLRGASFLTYQTLGGSFGVDRRLMIEELARVSHSPRYVAWDAVTGKPTFFPVNEHYVNVQTEMVGLATLVGGLEQLRAQLGTIVEEDVAALVPHVANKNNPHGDTKAHIGLPLVQNYPPASTPEAQAGTSTQRYLTAKTAIEAIDAALPVAADTVTGKHLLNLGTLPGDDTDNTKPLTGRGVVNLLVTPVPNALNSLFDSTINQAEQPVQATPFPLTFPLFWKGIRCVNVQQFAEVVRSYTGIRSLRFDQNTGVFYFPVDVVAPALATTSSFVSAGVTPASVMSAVTLPLIMTN